MTTRPSTILDFNLADVDVSERPKWTSADLGDAMLAAALQHASKRGRARKDGAVDVNAWWRGGDDLHVRIWPGTGAAHDLVEQRTYSARDFARVALGMTLPEMMEHYGRTSSTPRPAPPASTPPEPQRPSPEAVGAAWDALCSRRTHESPAARWLDARGIPAALAWSGFATLDASAVRDLAASSAHRSRWLGRYVDAAIVAPIRSARTGDVVALQARAFDPASPDEKRRTIGKLSDEDGTPRAYGRPDRIGSAALVLLVEGLVDTLAADVLASYADRVIVVGAVDAGGMPKIAAWLAAHSTAPVVVVRHLDGVETDGAGQAAADEAVRLLGKRARHFAWGRVDDEPGFLARLLSLGADARPRLKKGFDLGDALALAADEDVRASTVAASFLAAIGAALSSPGGSS